SEVIVPANEPVGMHIASEVVMQAGLPKPQATVQRNENIQINLIDNNALNDRLGRDGVEIAPIRDFTAVRSDYAAEFGGLGANINIIASDQRKAYHGDV